MKKIVMDWDCQEKRMALLDDQRLDAYYIEQSHSATIVGNLYVGIVRDLLPGMNAAFVDIGVDKYAYLPMEDTPAFQLNNTVFTTINACVKAGEKLLVRVVRDAEEPKGPRISAVMELAGDHLVYIKGRHYVGISKNITDPLTRKRWKDLADTCLKPDEGVILRTSFSAENTQELTDQLNSFREQYELLLKKANQVKAPAILERVDRFSTLLEKWMNASEGEVWANTDEALQIAKRIGTKLNKKWSINRHITKEAIFSAFLLEEELKKAVKKVVWLKNGAYLLFEKTEAMHVVDVNTGKFIGKREYNKTVLDTNVLAASEIGRQIVLRNLSGIILIDFINMKADKDRAKVKDALEAALKKDPLRSKIIGYTELGILQMTRKKEGPDLLEIMLQPCQVCQGSGQIESIPVAFIRLQREVKEHVYDGSESIWVDTTPPLFMYLEQNQEAVEQLRMSGKSFIFHVPSDKMVNQSYIIRATGSKQEMIDRMDRIDQTINRLVII